MFASASCIKSRWVGRPPLGCERRCLRHLSPFGHRTPELLSSFSISCSLSRSAYAITPIFEYARRIFGPHRPMFLMVGTIRENRRDWNSRMSGDESTYSTHCSRSRSFGNSRYLRISVVAQRLPILLGFLVPEVREAPCRACNHPRFRLVRAAEHIELTNTSSRSGAGSSAPMLKQSSDSALSWFAVVSRSLKRLSRTDPFSHRSPST